MLHFETKIKDLNKEWLVLLHGFGGNSKIWYKQIDLFEQYYNLLLIDFRGHGGSKDYCSDTKKYTTDLITQDIVEVLDYLGIEKAHFGGISLGTIVMHGLITRIPSRIKSMIFGGGVLGFKPMGQFLLHAGDVLKFFTPYMWIYRLFARIMMPKSHHKKSRDIFIREAKLLSQKEFIRWYRYVKSCHHIYNEVRNQNDNIPKIYISGEQDYMFIDEIKLIPTHDRNSSVHVIKNSGHVCNIEGSEEFNQVALDFLKNQKNKMQ